MTQETKTEKPALLLTAIPFAGFCGTFFSDLAEDDLRFCLESAEYLTDGEKEELDSLVYDNQDFSAVRLDIAREYAVAFNNLFKEETGIDLGLRFESMQSPREYNFMTDRIFCLISPAKVKELYKATDKKILADIIKEQFTSRDGFMSHYENTLDSWIVGEGQRERQKPCGPKAWDHNQIETLIIARLKQAGVDDDGSFKSESLSFRLYETLQDERCNGKFSCMSSQYTSVTAKPESVARMNEILEKERNESDFQAAQLRLPV